MNLSLMTLIWLLVIVGGTGFAFGAAYGVVNRERFTGDH